MNRNKGIILALGPAGTNSHVVAKFVDKKLNNNGSPMVDLMHESNSEVLKRFVDGSGNIAVMPTVNGRGGLVDEVIRFWMSHAQDDRCFFLNGGNIRDFGDKRVYVVGEVEAAIHHQLLVRPTVNSIDELTMIISHPQAVSQCSSAIRKWNIPTSPAGSTAAAARHIAKKGGKPVGAIASMLAGEIYGLKVLATDIEDVKDNSTLFHLLGRKMADKTGEDRTAMLFWLPDTPGALSFAINPISSARINMTYIQAIPLGKLRKVAFYVELDGHVDDPVTASVLTVLARATEKMSILGSFPRGEVTTL